jgi:cytochrome bd-type quinol oxidase subunit 1
VPTRVTDDVERELRRRDRSAKVGTGCLGLIIGLVAFLVLLVAAILALPHHKDGTPAVNDVLLVVIALAIVAVPFVAALIGWRSAVPMRKYRQQRAIVNAAADAEQRRRDLME